MEVNEASGASDELQVRNLIARIAQLADMGGLDDYVQCFTRDACWEMPGAPRRGWDDIRAGGQQRRATGQSGPGSASRHVITTVAVSVAGDVAEATSYWQFYIATDSAPQLQSMGHYDDEFVRTADGWRLDRRHITIG